MKRWQQYHQPPRTLRKARLDNIAIVPASLLPQKARYQALANQLPVGEVLVVLPAVSHSPTLAKTIALFESKGRHVTTVLAADLAT